MRRRALLGAAVALAPLALLTGPAAAPAAAEETTFSETCSEVYGKGAIGDLDKDTNPARDSLVAPGQAIDVTLRWPNKFVAGEREHRVLECATTNGGAPWLWAERRMVTAEGTTSLSVAVPSGSDAGSKVCSQSILVTKGSFGPVRRWSETTCHRVAAVEKKAMEPLVRRDDDDRSTSTTSDEDDEYARDRKRKEEQEKRRKEEEERKRKEEEARKRTTTTVKTEVTLPPTTSPPETSTSTTTTPPPVVAASPPPTRAPQAVPSPPPPKAPIVSAGRPAARPQAGGAPPAGQLARTGTGLLGLFLLGGATLITGRLLRRTFPARGGRRRAPQRRPEHREPASEQLQLFD